VESISKETPQCPAATRGSVRETQTILFSFFSSQRDFLEPGGFGEMLGNDISKLTRAIEPCKKVLAAARTAGMLVIHTREGKAILRNWTLTGFLRYHRIPARYCFLCKEWPRGFFLKKKIPFSRHLLLLACVHFSHPGHRTNLVDVHPQKKKRMGGKQVLGTQGPLGKILIRGEAGHDIIPELYPLVGEPIVDVFLDRCRTLANWSKHCRVHRNVNIGESYSAVTLQVIVQRYC
jgi:nicotinamidase-related amidase